LTLLYARAARLHELVDLRVGDLRLDSPALVALFGKGRRTRGVPLTKKTIAMLRKYLQENRYTRHPAMNILSSLMLGAKKADQASDRVYPTEAH
jgi:site-specific recombinase XerD